MLLLSISASHRDEDGGTAMARFSTYIALSVLVLILGIGIGNYLSP
jgi:hypothetical protein